MEVLVLRFDALLMSFGGVIVDQHNVTDRFPGTAMLTGLLANALGWQHGDADALAALQVRLVFAARWDVEPEPLLDYHTVDLGQPKMREPGWTTRGAPEHRDGGDAARYGTHQRLRHYWANGVMTLALALHDGDGPTLEALEHALRAPARPLLLGRKTCLPSGPLLLGRASGRDVLEALARVPRAQRPGSPPAARMAARWPAELGAAHASQVRTVHDLRD